MAGICKIKEDFDDISYVKKEVLKCGKII